MVNGWLDSNSNFLRPPVVNRWFSIYKTELSVFIAKSECVVCTNHRCCSFCSVFWEEIISEIPWTQLFARWIPLWSSSSGGNWGPCIAMWETLNKKPSPTLAQQRFIVYHWIILGSSGVLMAPPGSPATGPHRETLCRRDTWFRVWLVDIQSPSKQFKLPNSAIKIRSTKRRSWHPLQPKIPICGRQEDGGPAAGGGLQPGGVDVVSQGLVDIKLHPSLRFLQQIWR